MKKFGLFALVILSTITVYALSKANAEEYSSNVQERTEYLQKRSESLKKLHKLGLMFITYASGHNGKYPDTLQDVQAYAEDVNNFKLIIENVEYLGKGKTVTIDPQAVIGYDKELLEESDSKGTNVLYNDCHVAFEKADLLKEKGIVTGQKQIEIEARILFINEGLLANLKDANVITDVNCGNLLNESQCALLLHSTQAHNTSKLLTAPRVTVLDGEEATIRVTRETQYIAGYNEPNESSTEPLPKIESIETGLKLKVLPKLLEKTDKIKLDFNFEYTEAELESYLYNGKYGFQRPRNQVIQISSSVVVSDGQTLLVGGQNVKTKDGSQIIVVLIKAQKTNSAEAQTTAELENNLKSGCR